MARAQKHTKTTTRTVTEEVTTYTLELSAEEAVWLAAHLGVIAQTSGFAADIEQAVRQPEPADPAPLATGDRIRVLREHRESDGDTALPGAYTVQDPFGTGAEFVARRIGYGSHYLPADGEGTVWERI